MSTDFILVPNVAKVPTGKAEQIAVILHGSVRNMLYRVFQSSAPLSRLTDYSHFFTVTFDDLVAYLLNYPEEFYKLLPTESWDGVSVLRDGQVFSFREHDRGSVVRSEQVEGSEAAITRWLRWHLRNQGLQKLVDKYGGDLGK